MQLAEKLWQPSDVKLSCPTHTDQRGRYSPSINIIYKVTKDKQVKKIKKSPPAIQVLRKARVSECRHQEEVPPDVKRK